MRANEHSYCRELLGPYVLGGLEEAEVYALERHLRVCTGCRDEVAGLRVAAELLGAAHHPPAVSQTTEPIPPPGLKDRVLAAVLSRRGPASRHGLAGGLRRCGPRHGSRRSRRDGGRGGPEDFGTGGDA